MLARRPDDGREASVLTWPDFAALSWLTDG
jgi:hypothetical protein